LIVWSNNLVNSIILLKKKIDNIDNDKYKVNLNHGFNDEITSLNESIDNMKKYLDANENYKNQTYQNISPHPFSAPCKSGPYYSHQQSKSHNTMLYKHLDKNVITLIVIIGNFYKIRLRIIPEILCLVIHIICGNTWRPTAKKRIFHNHISTYPP
jgi:hypothetical protein